MSSAGAHNGRVRVCRQTCYKSEPGARLASRLCPKGGSHPMQVAEPSPLATHAAETAPDAVHPLRTESSRSDHGLHEDMRLLGRLLGQTVRQHEGQEAFERIESIRRLSISASRNDREAAAKLDALLSRLT